MNNNFLYSNAAINGCILKKVSDCVKINDLQGENRNLSTCSENSLHYNFRKIKKGEMDFLFLVAVFARSGLDFAASHTAVDGPPA